VNPISLVQADVSSVAKWMFLLRDRRRAILAAIDAIASALEYNAEVVESYEGGGIAIMRIMEGVVPMSGNDIGQSRTR
jgi:hypothetical protein